MCIRDSFSGDSCRWNVRLLQLERMDELVSGGARLALRAWEIRGQLKRSRFDERFHLWELEAIRSIATSTGGILDPSRLAEELISHLVALLGVRSAHLYLGERAEEASCVGGFGQPVLDGEALSQAWQSEIFTDDVVGVHLQSDSGTLGVLVVADKEARAGTEPFGANDVRLLELFAIQVTLAMEFARLSRESLERERLRRELEVAAVIQSHLHPQSFPEVPGYRLAARHLPSRQVAGDTYDVLVQDGCLLVTVTDVSGKGVGAGMIAAGVHAGVRLLAREGSSSLRELAERVNRYLYGATADNRFATFAILRVLADGSLTAVSAGHCPVLIRRRGGVMERIGSTGLPLGIMDDAAYREVSSRLEPGDLVLLYTDGFSEAHGSHDEEFGVDRIERVTAGLETIGAEVACEALLAEVDRHTGGQSLQDDATLVVLERLG